jgi:hypothetical protein
MTFLKKEILRTTTKPRRIVLVLVAAVAVVSSGYILALAVLAQEQLAEATTAATDLVCSGCVGTTDIADSAVTSPKIGSGQVANSDLATDAITSSKIKAGEVKNSDLASSAVTTGKISDTAGVQSVDIVNGQVKTEDIANDAIKPNVHIVLGNADFVSNGEIARSDANCPSGEILTGGGVGAGDNMRIIKSYPLDVNTWHAAGFNNAVIDDGFVQSYAICIGPSP